MYEPASNPNIDRFLSDVQLPVDWGKAMASLNRLAMFDMLPALQLYRNRDETAFVQFGQNLHLNRPPISSERVLWAWRVVQENHIPPPIGDLARTGQVNDVHRFLAERAQSLASLSNRVPKELLDAADKGLRIDRKQLATQVLTPQQAQFIVRYFLYAADVLAERRMPRSNGMLLVAQTGLETSYGARGPNPAHNNFLSFQPPKTQQEHLRSRGILTVDEKRVNVLGKKAQSTPVPHFKDIRQSIEIQLDIVYKEIWPELGRELTNPRATAESYGRRADSSHYSGVPYMSGPATLPSEYRKRLPLVTWALKNLPPELRAETKTWATKLAEELMRR